MSTSNQIDIGWLGDPPATDFRDVRYSGMTPQMHALTKAGMIIPCRAPVSISWISIHTDLHKMFNWSVLWIFYGILWFIVFHTILWRWKNTDQVLWFISFHTIFGYILVLDGPDGLTCGAALGGWKPQVTRYGVQCSYLPSVLYGYRRIEHVHISPKMAEKPQIPFDWVLGLSENGIKLSMEFKRIVIGNITFDGIMNDFNQNALLKSSYPLAI